MNKRTFHLLALSLIGAAVMAPVHAQTKEVTIAHQDMVVPWRYAQSIGEIEKVTGYKITFRKFGGGGDVIRAMASGQVQIGEAGSAPVASALSQGLPVELVWILDDIGAAEALVARQFLAERGFDQEAALRFGVGFSPRDGEALLRHLRGRGFSVDELVAAGLAAVGRSAYDKFRGRLMWPIRDATGDTIGFGARRIFDDDRIEAKYLNTSETTIYKKSQVLYGLDLARREIAKSSRAVIVEGYTDVMACHLAGVGQAVATCGTAFGDEHAKVLRRFLHDHEEFRGEVIFTFDGDAAGQKAAMRAFNGDQNFVSQTYVAVEPTGLDPCDLRIQQGDGAVRELVARRVPLYRFVLGNVVGPIFVYATSLISVSMILASGLSFLGLGVRPPEPEWGLMLNTLRTAIYVSPVVAALPGVCIFIVSIAFNLFSDGLRSAMEIRQ